MTLSRRAFATLAAPAILRPAAARRPNILFAIADDQSWLHTSAMGDPVVSTPNFDRITNSGVLFRNAFCSAPQCAPSRAALLTSRNIWQLEEAGTHASLFPRKFTVYTDLLAQAGYHVGLTGKGAGPCDWQTPGWPHNPAGREWVSHKVASRQEGINPNDYAANFGAFLEARNKNQPFCFWFGSHEPHRTYAKGSGVASGKKLADIRVPAFLPDTEEVRGDLADYLTEIEYFDRQLGAHLALIERAGELSNTLVVVTSDNGMSFPHAKANLYDHGWHLPLAIAWPDRVRGGRTLDDMVSFLDFAPTFLEAAGLKPAPGMIGRSLLPLLGSNKAGIVDPKREKVFAGRERHSHARFDNLGYPARAIRTRDHLYIRNFKPDRWPAGDPEAFADIDDGPSKSYVTKRREDARVAPLFAAACGKRPEEELFALANDPGCLENLATSPAHASAKAKLRAELDRVLTAQGDPRMRGSGVFDSYPRTSPMRPSLGGFATQGEYNPRYR